MEKMTKAEQMHSALVRFADLEKYHHLNKGGSDDIFQFLQNAPEESKERLYDIMAARTALCEVPQSDIAERLCVDVDGECGEDFYNAERLEAAEHIDDLNLKIAELKLLLEKGGVK